MTLSFVCWIFYFVLTLVIRHNSNLSQGERGITSLEFTL